MKKFPTIAAVTMVIFAVTVAQVHAAGTPVCTEITNKATATYKVGTVENLTKDSNEVLTIVDELLEATLTWEDAAPVPVNLADEKVATTFLLTNTGNGNDTWSLAGLSTLAGDPVRGPDPDQFDPQFIDIYLDADGSGDFDIDLDAAGKYVDGDPGTHPALGPDESALIFVINDIPATGPVNGDIGATKLTATSNSVADAPKDPGTVIPDGGECPLTTEDDAIVGTYGGQLIDYGQYLITNVEIDIVKSVSIEDPFGGTAAIPGSIMTYTIRVDVTGDGTAEGVIITDSIPEETTYQLGTLELNTASLSDDGGDDAGEVVDTDADTLRDFVRVRLGDLVEASETKNIVFQVEIK